MVSVPVTGGGTPQVIVMVQLAPGSMVVQSLVC